MSSGEKSQRMSLLITKSGPRITPTQILMVMVIASVFIVVEVVVRVTDTMLLSFYTDLVEGCNSWQISMSYFRNVQITTGKKCSTHGAVQLKRISTFQCTTGVVCGFGNANVCCRCLSSQNSSYNPLLSKGPHYIFE